MASGPSLSRRDTPAARAALARRRQRAAQNLRPDEVNNNNTTVVKQGGEEEVAAEAANVASSAPSLPPKRGLSPLAQRAITKNTGVSPSASPKTTDGTLTTATTLSVSTPGIPSYSSTLTTNNDHDDGEDNNNMIKMNSNASTTAAALKARLQRHRYPTSTSTTPTSSLTPPQRQPIVRPSTKGTLEHRHIQYVAANRAVNPQQQQQQEQQNVSSSPIPPAIPKVTTTPTRPSSSSVIPRRKASPQKTLSPRKQPSPRRFMVGKPPSGRGVTTTSGAISDTQKIHNNNNNSIQNSPTGGLRASKTPFAHGNDNDENSNNNNKTPSPQPSKNSSPGITNFLMDETFADISTIADMTMHQLDTPIMTTTTTAAAAAPFFSPPTTKRQQVESIELHNKSPYHLENTNYINNNNNINESRLLEDSFLILGNDQKDSACLYSGSTIMIRSCSKNATLQAAAASSSTTTTTAATTTPVEPSLGLGLGKKEEIMKLIKINKTDGGDSDELFVHHGDLVCFQSAAAAASSSSSNQFFLGAKRSMESEKMELCFFPASSKEGEPHDRRHYSDTTAWMILSATKSEQKVLVGRTAIANQQKEGKKGGPIIRSGDPILLRHCTTGGVLSIGGRGGHGKVLSLLTDSYDASRQRYEDPSLMGRLQDHDKLYPSKDEIFQLLLSSTPPCPQWVSSREERIFLTGSYLLQSKRNQINSEFESNMFDYYSIMSQSSALQHIDTTVDSDLSSNIKEKILIDEIIGSFLGLEGLHIKLVKERDADGRSNLGNSQFKLVGQDGIDFDVSLRNLVEQILPLSTSYVRVQNFISSHHPGYEYGRVMQSFCEGLDGLLQDYVNFVVQMERQLRKYIKRGGDSSLTMKSIYFQITPSLHSMSILEHATRAVNEKKGGALINALWSLERLVYMGDVVARKVLGILLEKSSIPYMDMMSAWLRSGHLQDPYEEFMVKRSDAKFSNSLGELDGDAWVAMFTIHEDHVVDGVTSDEWTKEKILTTGKYWNAAHACQVDIHTIEGLDSSSQKIPKLPFNSDSSAIASYIDVMYQSASKVLVRLLKDNFQLTESLSVMKRYFLLDQGDFLMHFLDATEEELRKESVDVSIGRVQNCLSMSIQLAEGYRDDGEGTENKCPLVPGALRCRFDAKETLQGGADSPPLTPARHAYGTKNKGPTAIETFSIDFPHLPFPISLVLSKHAMGNYKLLFRHLFFTKHVERRLIAVWSDHQMLKKLDSLRGLLGPTFLLRQRMLHFVQNLLYYMSFEVIEDNWTEMISLIDMPSTNGIVNQKPQTVDDILKVHNSFLQKTLDACLLTKPELIQSLTKIMSTCLLFTDQMRRFMDTTKIYDDSINLAAEKRGAVQRNLHQRSFNQNIEEKKVRRAIKSTMKERGALNQRQTRRVGREIISESYKRMVQRFDEVFSADLKDFMMHLNSHTASGLVANLGIRLDYNGYVTASLQNDKHR